MAYQPLYATVEDENGQRSTHSLRSRVEWIRFWLNSHFGSVMTVNARSEGSLQKKDVYEAREKIKHWAEEGNQKRVKTWEKKLHEREKFNREQECKESVDVEINVNENPKYSITLNGIRFSQADLKLLDKYKQRDFLGKLSIASAFALIPDIQKVVENPSKENVKKFTEKRDKITKFLQEEEKKLEI